ncbi:MAG: serine/threonine-protein kinase [Akkermansia sp.]|nr:serine/threonine-protein kinase [Akkermansia sp.]
MSTTTIVANPIIAPEPGKGFLDMDDIINQIMEGSSEPPTSVPTTIPGVPAPKELPENYMMKNYRLIRHLGEGGFGVTYLAEDVLLNRLVVLKESFPHTLCERQAGTLDVVAQLDADPEDCRSAMTNFLREVRLLAKLDHPNIVKIYTFFEKHQTAYYVTEYIDGKSLADVVTDYIRHLNHLPQDDLYSLMVRVLDALDYLHNNNILHLDLKPDNILVTRDGRPIVIDMGAARECNADACNGVVESVGFSPPEQCGPDVKNLGPWTDLYAFGATLYYLLTQTPPPASGQRLLYDTLDPLASIPKLTAIYHPQLLASIDKALSPTIEQRYQNVSEWMEDLRPH